MPNSNTNHFFIDLSSLAAGACGITPPLGDSLAEAASVCLESQNHSSPKSMEVHTNTNIIASDISWSVIDKQMRRAWNDDEVATEYGACGVAILVVREINHLDVVERSKKGTGFDYWLGSSNNVDDLFQRKARLEVSGIRTGSLAHIKGRLKQKIEQTKKSDGKLPAVIVVVEFGKPQTHIIER